MDASGWSVQVKSVKLADKPDSVRRASLRLPGVTAINLGRESPTRLNATYPHTPGAPSTCAYLVLLRVEIARFTRTESARLCCSDPHLTVERCYLLRCPVQSGRSSSAWFPRLHQRRSGKLHAFIIALRHNTFIAAHHDKETP